jgi:hypothetical protein
MIDGVMELLKLKLADSKVLSISSCAYVYSVYERVVNAANKISAFSSALKSN